MNLRAKEDKKLLSEASTEAIKPLDNEVSDLEVSFNYPLQWNMQAMFGVRDQVME